MTSPLCVATGGWCRRVFHYRPPTPMYRNSPPLCTIVLQIPSLMPLKMRKVQLRGLSGGFGQRTHQAGTGPGNVWRATDRTATPALTRNGWSSAGGWPRRALGCATWQGDDLLSCGGVDGTGRCAGQQSTLIRLSLRLVEVGGDGRAGAVVQRRSPKSLRVKICVNTDDCLTSFAVIVQRSCQAQLVSNPVSRRSCR